MIHGYGNRLLTLFGNASSRHLAYDAYPKIRITNNEACYVVLQINEDALSILVKNEEFAVNFRHKRGWSRPEKNAEFDAFCWGSSMPEFTIYKLNALVTHRIYRTPFMRKILNFLKVRLILKKYMNVYGKY